MLTKQVLEKYFSMSLSSASKELVSIEEYASHSSEHKQTANLRFCAFAGNLCHSNQGGLQVRFRTMGSLSSYLIFDESIDHMLYVS